jgi:hypothetical protein
MRFLGWDDPLVAAAEFLFHRDGELHGSAGQVAQDGSDDPA